MKCRKVDYLVSRRTHIFLGLLDRRHDSIPFPEFCGSRRQRYRDPGAGGCFSPRYVMDGNRDPFNCSFFTEVHLLSVKENPWKVESKAVTGFVLMPIARDFGNVKTNPATSKLVTVIYSRLTAVKCRKVDYLVSRRT